MPLYPPIEFIDNDENQSNGPFAEFLKRILNAQTYRYVEIDKVQYDDVWFKYYCFRKLPTSSEKIDLKGRNTHLVFGIKGSGKSSLLENIAYHHDKIIDVYGSKDDECLASLRMHKYTKRHERGLIVGYPNVDVISSWDYITFDKLTLHDIEKYDVITVPQAPFPDARYFYQACQKILDVIWSRKDTSNVWYIIAREVANILYSRIMLKRANTDQAKAYLVFLLREMRHIGISFGADAQYSLSVDREIRTNADYMYFKNLGSDKIPSDIAWMYSFFNFLGFMTLNPWEFVCKDRRGNLYAGWFKLPPWHKSEKENIYKSLDIKIERGDIPKIQEIIQPDNMDIIIHNEIINAFMLNKSFKGTARATAHNIETVKKHVTLHQEAKCPCFRK